MKRSTGFGVLVAAVIVAFFLVQIVDNGSDDPSKNQESPDFDMTLVSEMGGEDAISDVKAMHGGSERLKLVDVSIQDYQTNDGRPVRVWVGIAENETSAREMLTKMNSGIRYSNAFTHVGNISFDDVEVHKAGGMGMTNFYFAKGNSVIWVAGDLSDDEFFGVVSLLSSRGRLTSN